MKKKWRNPVVNAAGHFWVSGNDKEQNFWKNINEGRNEQEGRSVFTKLTDTYWNKEWPAPKILTLDKSEKSKYMIRRVRNRIWGKDK